MPPTSDNAMDTQVCECNDILTTSGCKVGGYDLLNSAYHFAFHELTSYL